MKRSPLKRKPFKSNSSTLSRSTLKRKRDTPRTSKGLFPKKASKADEWNSVREELKPKFANAGILSCELRYEGCWGCYNFSEGWSFAHSLKRSQISNEPEQRYVDIREVIYACRQCHLVIEKISNKERFDGKPKMSDIVRGIIKNRQIQIGDYK